MMLVLKATREQANFIENNTGHPNKIKFIQNNDGFWIVGKEVLTDTAFEHLQSEFQQLEEIEYNPIIQDEL